MRHGAEKGGKSYRRAFLRLKIEKKKDAAKVRHPDTHAHTHYQPTQNLGTLKAPIENLLWPNKSHFNHRKHRSRIWDSYISSDIICFIIDQTIIFESDTGSLFWLNTKLLSKPNMNYFFNYLEAQKFSKNETYFFSFDIISIKNFVKRLELNLVQISSSNNGGKI